MKRFVITVFFAIVSVFFFQVNTYSQVRNTGLTGAWEAGPQNKRMVRIHSGKHFSVAVYNKQDNTFLETYGGSWRLEGNTCIETYEFHTSTPDLIGKEVRYDATLKNDKLMLKKGNTVDEWTRLDNGEPGRLGGAWVITGRENDGQMRKMTPGARKTMKILSGTRFQWIAYNSETKEFFGTGGGSYTSENGKYVELIDFFSRDSTRVGMSLEFDFSLDGGHWHHKGASSKGEPISEIWTQRDALGI